jgi:glycosyltransferase involved in cell wall biosynthesis
MEAHGSANVRPNWGPHLERTTTRYSYSPAKDDVVEALQDLYENPGRRAELSRQGMALVHQPRFRWEAIARQFDERLQAPL